MVPGRNRILRSKCILTAKGPFLVLSSILYSSVSRSCKCWGIHRGASVWCLQTVKVCGVSQSSQVIWELSCLGGSRHAATRGLGSVQCRVQCDGVKVSSRAGERRGFSKAPQAFAT